MVGLNPFASRHHSPHHTPPPSYKPNDPSPVLFAETTVTTTETITTTTQTTTHFFSLPLWKKRPAPIPFNNNSAPGIDLDADEMGYLNSSKFKVDKELPPTPADSSGHGTPLTSSRAASRRSSIEQETFLRLPPDSGRRSSGNSSRPTSTSALAHASLGLSLPHASSSSAEINSIAFASSSEIHSHPRREPSAHAKPRAVSTAGRSAPPDISNNRRMRGLSLGPSGFLGLGSADLKGKGKEKETEKENENHTPSKLHRRSSFWSRKKVTSPDFLLPQAHRSEVNLVPLPALPPLSPFSVDMMKPSEPSSSNNVIQPQSQSQSHLLKPHHTRGLSRSHSEKFTRVKTSNSHALPPPTPPQPERVRRPKTADVIPSAPRFSSASALGGPLSSSPLPSPTLDARDPHFPLVSDPPPPKRPRAQTNPPLLRRLSMGLFSTSPSSAPPPPLPPTPTAITSPSPLRISTSKPASAIPKPQVDEESPEIYLTRLMVSVSKAEIGGILASSSDAFHVQALRSYIGRFDFSNDPLDVALRRLLMDVGLPRETQQIDRVMEAFASRYYQLHPGLFTSEDQPYILSFSLIMLHTDAFNKSNKRKMTKADYIKNTRMPGVHSEILDCFYDNIVFAPFIFVEDPVDVNGQRGFSVDGSRALSASSSSSSMGGSALLGKGSKVDPYYLISNNLLDPLRIDVELFVPLINPYSSEGTGGPWNEEELQHAFSNPYMIELNSLDSARVIAPAPYFSGGGSAGGPFSVPGELIVPSSETVQLKVTKVGLLTRKDDLAEGGRKSSNRKWKSFSVVLTGSQLLLVRDATWAPMFLDQNGDSGELVYPQTVIFKPDEVVSVNDAIAVYDRSYTKHNNVFRLALADGRHFLFGTASESEMNEWISRINYASAFKSTGVRMRPVGMSGRDVQLTGVAAATSHLHDLQHHQNHSKTEWNSETSRDLMGMLSGDPISPFRKTTPKRQVTIMSSTSDVDNDVPVAPEVDGADQFKATFDQVKADLAAGRSVSSDSESFTEEDSPERRYSLPDDNTRLPSRSRVVVSKIRDLESKISASQTQLESDIRFVRNVATLTPFQRSTRERLSLAVQNLAKRIMQVRLDLVRYKCHRDVLYRDLEAEGRNWSRAKKMALRAAIETLQSHREPPLPRMTLSFHESNAISSSPVSIPSKAYTPSAHRPESTADSFQSFHSALEFGPEWSSPDNTTLPDRLASSRLSHSPKNSSTGSFNRDLLQEKQDGIAPLSSKLPVGRVSDVTSPRTSNDDVHHERFYTARESVEEQAEDWNKTRCAQRVSLVRVPSAIGLARVFERENSR